MHIRGWLVAAIAAPLVVACASGGTGAVESRDAKVLRSNASVGDLVLCLKSRLKDDATVIAYPEPGRVDIRIGDGSRADTHYFHLVSLSQIGGGANGGGTRVEIRSADEWHPLLSGKRVAGMVEDCKPGTAR